MASIPTAAPPGGDGLRRQRGLLDATINVGTIIGASIFIVPASIALLFTASFPTILVWIAGGLVSLCGAPCVAELPYRTGGYPVTPVVFILFSGYLILNTIREAPGDAVIGAALLLAGLPVYRYCRRRYGVVTGNQ